MTALAIRVDPPVAEAYAGYRALVLVARSVANGPSTEASRRILVEAGARARAALGGRPAADLAEIAAWRAAFSAFGAKPSRYPSSAEALLRRVARGDELPAINRLVDCRQPRTRTSCSRRCRPWGPIGSKQLPPSSYPIWTPSAPEGSSSAASCPSARCRPPAPQARVQLWDIKADIRGDTVSSVIVAWPEDDII